MDRSELALLEALRQDYRAAPAIYHATRYWERYEASIWGEVARLDPEQIDSGLYPYLTTFGFGTVPYRRSSRRFGAGSGAARRLLEWAGELRGRLLPYRMTLQDVHELAFANAELAALRAQARPPTHLRATRFGNPQDVFEVDGSLQSISFLTYFMRYCFAQRSIGFRGDEIFVEIGSGSGKQAIVLKQLLPDATFLCFDLPLQAFLAYRYALGASPGQVVDLAQTRQWRDLCGLQKGRVHFFGNWQVPLLKTLRFDVFWNAASFGEMEPDVVQRYLSYVDGNAEWVYLMQARHGKESGRARGGVERPQRFEDYCRYLSRYTLRRDQRAQGALRPYRESGGYFEAVWQRAPG